MSQPSAVKFSCSSKHYNIKVDRDGRRIWLEDDETKQQWQWLGEASPTVPSETENPEESFLIALKHIVDTKPELLARRVLLKTSKHNTQLLTVRERLDMSSSFVTKQFELEPLPLEKVDRVLAHQLQVRTSMDAMRAQLTAMQQQLKLAKEERVQVQTILSEFSDYGGAFLVFIAFIEMHILVLCCMVLDRQT